VARQKGSHIIMVKPGQMATLSVPDHREVAKGTLRSLIRAAGLTIDEFIAAI
jgi:predicted RNA binding protein YcfA (HicA-like mRNA interferase family)